MKLSNIKPRKNLTYCGTGHRPDKLKGGFKNFDFTNLVDFAESILIEIEPKIIISGMALGWDMALAKASINLHIPVIAAIPFDGQCSNWYQKDKLIYEEILKNCKNQVIVSSGGCTSRKFQIRNQYMVDNSDEVLALWDGSSGGTGNCIRYANSQHKSITNLWDKYQKFK